MELLTRWVKEGKAINLGPNKYQLSALAVRAYRVCLTLTDPQTAFSVENVMAEAQQKRLAAAAAKAASATASSFGGVPGALELTLGSSL